MGEPIDWDTVIETGLLFYINTILQFIGFVIVVEQNNDGKAERAYVCRTNCRGFDPELAEQRHVNFASLMSSAEQQDAFFAPVLEGTSKAPTTGLIYPYDGDDLGQGGMIDLDECS